MDNENKWEYDYSSQDKNESGDTGYPNVGSSGMNTANQYNDPQPEPETAYTAPQTDNGAGGATPPVHPVQPQDAQPPKKKKKFNGKRVARSAVALVLAAAMGFAGGFVGAKFGGSGKVVIQQVAPSSTADSASGSDSSITAASSSGSSLTTEQVADLVSPSVVVITTEQVVYSQWSWYGQNQVESGAGSGVIISSDGYILTCAHVVDGASNITVTIGDKDYTATLVGEDTTSDIAVIKIEASGLQAVALGDSEKLNVGDRVLAIGNPLGDLTFSMSGGMVSSVNRTINVDGTPFNMIQTDTSINPGNSGGPLLNSYGEVVGIVSAKYSSYGSSGESVEGLGFAIPINDVISMIQDIMTNGYVSNKAYLGATIGTLTSGMAQQYRYDISQGAFVYSVEDGSPAAAAGLQLGDVITAIDGTEITSLEDLTAAKKGYAAGDTSTLTIYRQGETMTLEMTWGAVSADQQSAVQGQTEQDQNTQNGGGYTNPYDLFEYFFG